MERNLELKFFVIPILQCLKKSIMDQAILAQWLARQLATGEVQGSNPGKEDNLINF